MPVTISSEAQLVFFNKVFGPIHPVTVKAKALLSQGVAFEVSLYNVKAQVKGKATQVNLTYGTTALMKGTADVVVLSQNKKLIEEWIGGLWLSHGSPEAPKKQAQATAYTVLLTGTAPGLPRILKLIKAVHSVTGGSVASAKQKVETAVAGTPVALGTRPCWKRPIWRRLPSLVCRAGSWSWRRPAMGSPTTERGGCTGSVLWDKQKPVDAVIDLKRPRLCGAGARHDTGSVKLTLTDHVKVAARLYQTGSISIRAEWTDNPTEELKLLAEAGLQMKPNYGSIHFDANDVPLQRVIGAFLLGTGINWKQVVTTGADLVIGEKVV
jgi:hypothetical protein